MMKRFLTLMLTVSLLLTSCVMLSSCDSGITKKDFEENPQEALAEAVQNTGAAFFADDMQILPVLQETMKKGKLSVVFESQDLMGGALTKIGETLYFDEADQKLVSDTLLTVSGEDMTARVFLEKTKLAFNSSALLGSDKTFFVDLQALFDQLKEEGILDEMPDAAGEAGAQANTLMTELKALLEKIDAESVAEIYRLLKQEIGTEKLALTDGGEAACITVSYTLNNETVKAVIEYVIEMIEDGTLKTEAKEEFLEVYGEFDANVKLNMIAKTFVNSKTNQVEKISLEGELANPEDAEEKIPVSLTVTFSETQILAAFRTEEENEAITAEIKQTKEEKDGKTVYTASVSGGSGSVTVNVLTFTYTYEKSTGNVVLKLDVMSEEVEDERQIIELTGNVKVDQKSAKIAFTSLKFNSVTVTFNLTFAFETVDEIPAVPADAKDIMALTEDEAADLLTQIEQSPLGSLLFALDQPGMMEGFDEEYFEDMEDSFYEGGDGSISVEIDDDFFDNFDEDLFDSFDEDYFENFDGDFFDGDLSVAFGEDGKALEGGAIYIG